MFWLELKCMHTLLKQPNTPHILAQLSQTIPLFFYQAWPFPSIWLLTNSAACWTYLLPPVNGSYELSFSWENDKKKKLERNRDKGSWISANFYFFACPLHYLFCHWLSFVEFIIYNKLWGTQNESREKYITNKCNIIYFFN